MKRFIYIMLAICILFGSSAHIGVSDEIKLTHEERTTHIEEVKAELTSEVDLYIKHVAPTSRVSARHLVDECHEYNVDIIFVLAQGTIESHFATKGIGGKINSIFNVCVYDNIKSGNGVYKIHRYNHPDDSIEPYLRLLCESYLVNGKTERDLLRNYVNIHGQRYASHPQYESQLASVMKRIKRTTKIDSLNQKYRDIQIQV